MWGAVGWSIPWQDELLTSVKPNHNRLPGLTDWQSSLSLASRSGPPSVRKPHIKDLLQQKRAWELVSFSPKLLKEIFRDHFEMNMIFSNSSLSVKFFFFVFFFFYFCCCLTRWRDRTGSAQWGADPMASIVPFQRGEGSWREGGREGERMATATATIGSLIDRSQMRVWCCSACVYTYCACVRVCN